MMNYIKKKPSKQVKKQDISFSLFLEYGVSDIHVNLNLQILDDQQDDPEDFETLFGSVVTAKDNDRDISTVFQLLPPKTVSLQIQSTPLNTSKFIDTVNST